MSEKLDELLDTLDARNRSRKSTGATMRPPITYRSSKSRWRKGVKKYVRKMQEAMANDSDSAE